MRRKVRFPTACGAGEDVEGPWRRAHQPLAEARLDRADVEAWGEDLERIQAGGCGQEESGLREDFCPALVFDAVDVQERADELLGHGEDTEADGALQAEGF